MGSYSDEEFTGIVVSRQDYRERDMLVTILTDRFGFKTFFCSGSAETRFSNASCNFTVYSRNLYWKNQWWWVVIHHDDEEVAQYQEISQDIELNAYASYILGLARQAFGNQPDLASLWFTQLATALQLIDEGYDPAIITNIIEVKLLGCFGVQPNWQACAVCGRDDLPFDYSEMYGGLLCQEHWHLDEYRLHLDKRTIYFLRQFSVVDLTKLNSISLKETTKRNLRRALDEIYNSQVGVYVKAKNLSIRWDRGIKFLKIKIIKNLFILF